MSSWNSHLPEEIKYRKVIGHGLNKEELEKVAKGTVKEIKKIESRGLMAQPQPTQQEIM